MTASSVVGSGITQSDFADSVSIIPSWVENLRGQFLPLDKIKFVVTNTASTGIKAVVEVRAAGLDGRVATRSITTVTVPGKAESAYTIKLADLPIRSVDVESVAEVRTTIVGGTHDGEVVSSRPLHYSRNVDGIYTLSGELPANPRLLNRPSTINQALTQLLPQTAELAAPRGDVLDSSGRYVDVGSSFADRG